MGRAYHTSKGNVKCMQTFGRTTSRERERERERQTDRQTVHEMKRGREDKIKTDFKELIMKLSGVWGMDRIDLVQNRDR